MSTDGAATATDGLRDRSRVPQVSTSGGARSTESSTTAATPALVAAEAGTPAPSAAGAGAGSGATTDEVPAPVEVEKEEPPHAVQVHIHTHTTRAHGGWHFPRTHTGALTLSLLCRVVSLLCADYRDQQGRHTVPPA